MTEELSEKYGKLLECLRALESAAVAFSGGVDSALLLYAAKEALKERVIAITAKSTVFPERELKSAREFCEKQNIPHFVIEVNELEIEGFRQNPPNRCYICKKHLFFEIIKTARENNLKHVVEGSNLDDEGDYRPGLLAIKELSVRSPLREAGLRKSDIRAISKALGLPEWGKPSFACLATRFPYGDEITEDKLSMIDRAEQLLLDMGITQVRVRVHGKIARIEALPEEFQKILASREEIYRKFKEIGFDYAALDLLGYRTGSMNERL